MYPSFKSLFLLHQIILQHKVFHVFERKFVCEFYVILFLLLFLVIKTAVIHWVMIDNLECENITMNILQSYSR